MLYCYKNDNASLMFIMSILQIEFCAWLKFSLMVCNHQGMYLQYCTFVHMHIKVHITITRLLLLNLLELTFSLNYQFASYRTGIPRPPFFIFQIITCLQPYTVWCAGGPCVATRKKIKAVSSVVNYSYFLLPSICFFFLSINPLSIQGSIMKTKFQD